MFVHKVDITIESLVEPISISMGALFVYGLYSCCSTIYKELGIICYNTAEQGKKLRSVL